MEVTYLDILKGRPILREVGDQEKLGHKNTSRGWNSWYSEQEDYPSRNQHC
jgi:hypothetical protein